jgi:hypothetical protein
MFITTGNRLTIVFKYDCHPSVRNCSGVHSTFVLATGTGATHTTHHPLIPQRPPPIWPRLLPLDAHGSGFVKVVSADSSPVEPDLDDQYL